MPKASQTEVVVEELFAGSMLSADDPVFVTYLPDRPPLRVAENGAGITKSNVQFSFFDPGEISVLTAESAVEGDFSTLMDHVCRHFGADHVVFVNVVTSDLAEKLHGFEWTQREIGGHVMDCLEGTWNAGGRS